MVREIIVWCSMCYDEDIRTEGKSVVVAIDGSKPLSVDICETHEKAIVEPVRVLIGEYGQRLDAAVPQPQQRRHICTECGVSLKTIDSLAKHMRRQHGDPSTDATEQGEHKCPECERSFERPQSLGAHRSRAHGYRSPTYDERKTRESS